VGVYLHGEVRSCLADCWSEFQLSMILTPRLCYEAFILNEIMSPISEILRIDPRLSHAFA
jgi:hypothetical protein